MTKLTPPPIRDTVPPGKAPSKAQVEYNSLLGKPTNLDDQIGDKAPFSTGPLELHSKGKPDLILQRDESTAAVLTVIEIKRNGVIKGFIGLDADDHIVILAKNGTTVLAEFDTDASQNFSMQLLRDASAGALPFLALKRQSTVLGYLGSDAADAVVIYAADGSTVLLTVTSAKTSATHFQATSYLDENGHQVVGIRQPAIANPVAVTGSSGPGGGTGGPSGDPATLGDVDGAYGAADAAYARAEDAYQTALAVLNTVVALLGAERTHGQIAP